MMLSEGKRDGLRLTLSRSLSEPGEVSPFSPLVDPSSLNPTPTLLRLPPTLSMPSSPCADSTSIQRSILLRKAGTIEVVDLARRLTKAQKVRSFVLLDVRSFVAFNLRHVRSAFNLNCADRINRRRLLQRKAGVVDLVASPSGRETLKRRCVREVIVYDDASAEMETLPPHHPLFLVLSALLEDNREPVLLKGGFERFVSAYPELCEDALMRPKASPVASPERIPMFGDATAGGSGPPSPTGGPQDENLIESAPVAQVLPFLYLGNAKDAQDNRVLEAHGIRRVLNVTSHPQPADDGRLRKSLPALDSAHQNLRQYFDEAIDYIEEARRVGDRILVHCEAGVSRSPTIVLAYLMKHTHTAMLDAYKLLKARRPVISPNLNFMGQLVEWEATLQSAVGEPECKSCHQCRQWHQQKVNKLPGTCHV